ncbi:MAG: 50S ribosomal protein L23 [Deltaproteobacteria bacterium]|jgi:large subunit ribosomal protein L23|nr:50S ribosomal protein L23 [Deltaproteobacteria bacterium]
MRPYYEILLAPILSEMATHVINTQNKYVFKVSKDANKVEIRKAIEVAFNVDKKMIRSVNTIIIHGKPKRVGRYKGYRSSWKKAVVTLDPQVKLFITAIES